MEIIITRKVENILDELKKMYPTGIILGDSYAIVGDFGLTIEWNFWDKENNRFVKSQERLKAGDKISITEIKGENFIFRSYVPNAIIHYSHFKGFTKRNQ